MLGLGSTELIVVLVIVLVLFGGAKLPQMMKGMGEGMREFKKATREDEPNSTTTTTTPLTTHTNDDSRRTPL